MTRLPVFILIAAVFLFAAYHDKPSDTEDDTNTFATITDAQADAVVAAAGRK